MSTSVTLILASGKEPEPWFNGQGLGQFANEAECNRVTDAQSLPRLSSFYALDVELLEEAYDQSPPEYRAAIGKQKKRAKRQPKWHEPQPALPTFQALLAHFSARQAIEDDPNDELGDIVEELTAIVEILKQAVAEGDRFRLELSQ